MNDSQNDRSSSVRGIAQPPSDPVLDAAIEAGLSRELPWWRVGEIVKHLVQVDWLRERGYVPAPTAPTVPAERTAELQAEATAIAARWRELAAQVRAGNPPKCEWITELTAADRRLINELHGYRPRPEQEAEGC